MPDILNSDGLQTKTASEIRTDLENALKDIYGADINLDQNSPDGQVVGILTQLGIDLRELITQVNNGFNPDKATGRVLDERVVINNIQRQGGTFTITPIDVTVDRTVTLDGLDDEFNDINGQGYTVQDDSGTEFILIDTTTLTTGTTELSFRARDLGEIQTTVGTITTPVTVVQGVTDINNSSAATTIGQDQETDAQLRLRRQRSISLASQGYLNGLLGSLLNVDGVTAAKVYENVTNSVDGDGIPAHGIWAIVEGGANSDIADQIFAKKSAGSDMKGAVTVDISTESGATFTAKFDRPRAEDLYIRFDIQPTTGSTFNQANIKEYIADNLSFGISDFAETSDITGVARTAINENGGGGVPVNVEISDDGTTWVDYLPAPTLDAQFVVDDTRITITEL